MPYNVCMPYRKYYEPRIKYRMVGGRNRPCKSITCSRCKTPRWVQIDNLLQLKTKICSKCRELSDRTCPNCQTVFSPRTHQKYCDSKCWREHQHKIMARRLLEKPPIIRRNGKWITSKCLQCNSEFEHSNLNERKFCSPRCSNVYNKKIGPDNPRYIYGKSYELKNYHRLTSSQWKATRKQIKIRDGYKCLVCREQSIKRRLSVHHVIPANSGGIDEHNNLMTTCRSCHTIVENRIELRPFLIYLLKRLYNY